MRTASTKSRMRRRLLMGSVMGVTIIWSCVACATSDTSGEPLRERTLEQRQEAVREAGAAVMGFDLDKTTHTFTKTETGGVQTVVANDPADTEQIELIRQHLHDIRDEFAAGRFDDPIAIHGADMDGVAELAAGYQQLEIVYHDIDGGGEITYTVADVETHGAMIGYLHHWFEAQIRDHGLEAGEEPRGHVMTEEMWRLHHPGQPYPGDVHGEQ